MSSAVSTSPAATENMESALRAEPAMAWDRGRKDDSIITRYFIATPRLGAPRACSCACIRRHAKEDATGRDGFDKDHPASSKLVQASVEGLNEESGVSTSPRLSARPGQSAPREHRGEQKKWGLLDKDKGIPEGKECPSKKGPYVLR